jgi:hypothetical protein
MNKTEKIAMRYLESQGFKNIVYQSNKTPDFLTETVKSFEVKLLRKNTIWFSQKQFESLLKIHDCYILIVDEKENILPVIPAVELHKPDEVWIKYGIKIIVGNEKLDEVVFNLRIPKEMYQEAQVYAKENYWSMNAFILLAIEKRNAEFKCNRDVLSVTKSVQLEPGLEALNVKRGKDGRFKKRNDK